MRTLLLIFCTFTIIKGSTQNVVDVDQNTHGSLSSRVFYTAGGHPVSTAKYVSIASGSPYLSETWMKGTISTPDSAEYANLRLRLDLLENTLIYLNDENQEMVSVVPIGRVSLRDTTTGYGKTYFFVHVPAASGSEKTWYQVLTMGKMTLYKQYYKVKLESKAYGSSVTEQTIKTEERYFILMNGAMTRVKKPKDIVDFAGNKTKELSEYIDKSKLGGKKESDFTSTVEFYNSLQ